MKFANKILSLTIAFILFSQSIVTVSCTESFNNEKIIKAAVFLNNISDLFISDVKKSLEDVQIENQNKVQFTFFDSKGNQVIENENIDEALTNNFDLFVVNPITTKAEEIEDALNKIIQKDSPLILYLPPASSLIKIVKSAPKAVIITGDVDQAGALQGKILSDEWKSNKEIYDRNKDNIMQYVMLQGPPSYVTTIARTKYSIKAINEAGIKTRELLSTVCNWDRNCAKITIESNFVTLGNKIEAIISNNDEMAIGAIEALQKYGFNKGDKTKYIPVVGIGGAPEAKELINKGLMVGTVIEDIPTQAKAIYTIGANMVNGKNMLDGTNFKFDEPRIVKIPYYEYVK